jgi:site-specific DNA-cytosine methylase
MGYTTLTFGENDRKKMLDASHYGLPKKRKRIYAISFLKTKINKNPNFINEYEELVLKQAKTKNLKDNQ